MGSAVVGWCKCGYETKEMFLGGGRMNFQTHCALGLFNKRISGCRSKSL